MAEIKPHLIDLRKESSSGCYLPNRRHHLHQRIHRHYAIRRQHKPEGVELKPVRGGAGVGEHEDEGGEREDEGGNTEEEDKGVESLELVYGQSRLEPNIVRRRRDVAAAPVVVGLRRSVAASLTERLRRPHRSCCCRWW